MNNAQPLLKRGFVDRVKEKMKKGKEAPESGKRHLDFCTVSYYVSVRDD